MARLRLASSPSVGVFSDHDAAVASSPTQSIELVDFDSVNRTSIGERREVTDFRESDTTERDDREAGYQDRAPETRIAEKGLQRSKRDDHGEKGAEGLHQQAVERRKHWEEALRRRIQVARGERKELKMKFSHSLQFNAVPDWSAYYIGYSNLKKL